MNKLIHWTLGSFFRTIGRIIAYVVIGFLIALLLSHSSIKKIKISDIFTDIFFMKVDALSLDGSTNGEVNLDSSPESIFLDNVDPGYTWNFYDFNSGTNDYLVIPFSGFEAYINHSEWNQDNYEVTLINTYTKIFIFTTDNSGNRACEFQNNMLVCPLVHNKTYNYMSLNFWYGGNPGGSDQGSFDLRFQMHNYGTFYKTSTTTIIENQNQNNQAIINNQNQNNQAIINNQNQTTQEIINNQNQQTQAINNTITDESSPSNLSSISNDSLVGYLPPGPVDSLLNLPLVLLSSLQNALSSSCSPVTLTLPFVNFDIVLPCMSTLYESMGVSSFVNWAGIVASAFILFSYLLRFYKWVDNTLTFRENNWLDNWGGE